jgi:hypothetical protein
VQRDPTYRTLEKVYWNNILWVKPNKNLRVITPGNRGTATLRKTDGPLLVKQPPTTTINDYKKVNVFGTIGSLTG